MRQATMLMMARSWQAISKAVYFLIPFFRLNTVTVVVHRPVANAKIAVCVARPERAAMAVIRLRSDHVNQVMVFGLVLFCSTSRMYGKAARMATTPDNNASRLCMA